MQNLVNLAAQNLKVRGVITGKALVGEQIQIFGIAGTLPAILAAPVNHNGRRNYLHILEDGIFIGPIKMPQHLVVVGAELHVRFLLKIIKQLIMAPPLKHTGTPSANRGTNSAPKLSKGIWISAAKKILQHFS